MAAEKFHREREIQTLCGQAAVGSRFAAVFHAEIREQIDVQYVQHGSSLYFIEAVNGKGPRLACDLPIERQFEQNGGLISEIRQPDNAGEVFAEACLSQAGQGNTLSNGQHPSQFIRHGPLYRATARAAQVSVAA